MSENQKKHKRYAKEDLNGPLKKLKQTVENPVQIASTANPAQSVRMLRSHQPSYRKPYYGETPRRKKTTDAMEEEKQGNVEKKPATSDVSLDNIFPHDQRHQSKNIVGKKIT